MYWFIVHTCTHTHVYTHTQKLCKNRELVYFRLHCNPSTKTSVCQVVGTQIFSNEQINEGKKSLKMQNYVIVYLV